MPTQDMLINYVAGEECRIAIVEDGKLEELYTERASDDIHVGSIYRGRITNVEPSIQAAFVDFGLDRNGFLHISDLHPRYFGGSGKTERVGKRTPRRDRPPIQQALKRGQSILVQVLKEGIGTKGPTLTSYLSIPGRFLVMMPDMERHGVSRKVDDEDARREMRKILDELDPPDDLGFIVRTAGIGRTKTEMKRDLAYLLRLWKTIEQRQRAGGGPCELYRESDLVIRTLRDVLNTDIKRIIVDDAQAARRAQDFLRIAMPRGAAKVYYYDKPIPLFDAFSVEPQIASMNHREVPMPSGGSLVIDTTEAMVAIDVNSGKFRDKGDAESTAYHTNQEAVDEIARQLRLRDLGGVLVLDLIDMYQNKHRREIERRFKENLKKDRARSKTLKINELGLLSLTRQRMRPSLKRSINEVCPTCEGRGVVRTAESVTLDVMRQVAVVLSAQPVHKIEVRIAPTVGAMVLNRKRHALHLLEEHLEKRVQFIFDDNLNPDEVQITALDARGSKLDIDKLPQPKAPKLGDDDEVEARLGKSDAVDEDTDWNFNDQDPDDDPPTGPTDAQKTDEQGEGKSGRRRRRRRGGRGRKRGEAEDEQPKADQANVSDTPPPEQADESVTQKPQAAADDDASAPSAQDQVEGEGEGEGEGEPNDEEDQSRKRRRRRRGGRRHRRRKANAEAAEATQTQSDEGTRPAADEPPHADAPRIEAEPESAEPDKNNGSVKAFEPASGPAKADKPDDADSTDADEAPPADKPKRKTTRRKPAKSTKKTSRKTKTSKAAKPQKAQPDTEATAS